MTYIECPECGHKALGVATRCPRCGFAFPARPLHRPDAGGRRDWPSALLAGMIVLGAAASVAMLRWPGAGPSRAAGPAAQTIRASTARAPRRPAAESNAPRDSAAPRAAGTIRAGTPGPSSRTTTGGAARYARTWVNVRDGRDRAASSVRVLNPGEQVIVDSLQGGWYRVVADGQPLGYVHRSNLDAAPPGAQP